MDGRQQDEKQRPWHAPFKCARRRGVRELLAYHPATSVPPCRTLSRRWRTTCLRTCRALGLCRRWAATSCWTSGSRSAHCASTQVVVMVNVLLVEGSAFAAEIWPAPATATAAPQSMPCNFAAENDGPTAARPRLPHAAERRDLSNPADRHSSRDAAMPCQPLALNPVVRVLPG